MADSSASEQVAILADEFLARHRAGERPSIREYVEKYPALADEIRDVFPAVAMMERVAIGDEGPTEPTVVAPPARQIGDFRIVREIGRGGMGVVYEAEQISLGRFVALKLLPPQLTATDQVRQRFFREARAAAKLHHTNIVPVFAVGEADGTPYYAMQHIRGRGLDAVIEELRAQAAGAKNVHSGTTVTHAADLADALATGAFVTADDGNTASGMEPPPARPTPPDTVAPAATAVVPKSAITAAETRSGRNALWHRIARIGLQVAGALDHAHGQGILHRDIKPSNLLLDVHGNVWVTDFGLAKAEGLPDITRAGDVLGTLRYMPPEAFDGKSDARGDVYALGLTIYELLALRPAFGESDRGRLVKMVTTAEPERLRKVVPGLPGDLATIVHKAVQKDPARRYQTAAALADDLQRFLDDRPIAARPVSALEHAWRACKRNPVVSGMTAAALLGLVVGLVGALWGRSAARTGERDAQTQKNRAEQNANDLRDERDEVTRLKDTLADRLYISDMNRVKSLLDQGNTGVAGKLLAQYRPPDGAPDRRGFEWYYLNRLANTESRVIRFDQRTGDASFSPSGARLVVCGDGLRILSVSTGEVVRAFPADSRPGQWLYSEFAPDGKGLVSIRGPGLLLRGGAELQIWTDKGERTRVVPLKQRAYHFAVRSATNEAFVACEDGVIRAYDTNTWAEKYQLKGHTDQVLRVAVSPGGEWVASGGMDATVRLWARDTGAAVVLKGGLAAEPIFCLVFRPDGRQLATSHWGGEVKFWDLTTDPPRYSYSITPNARGLVYSPDGSTLAVGTDDGPIRLFDPVSGRPTGMVRGHDFGASCVAFSPDGRLLASTATQSLRVWSLNEVTESRAIPAGADRLEAVALSPDGTTVVSGGGKKDSVLKVYHAADGKLKAVRPTHGAEGIRRAKFSADGKLLATVGDDGVLNVWDAVTWPEKPLWSANCLSRGQYWVGVADVEFSPNGEHLLTGTWHGGGLFVWDVRTGALTREWRLPIDGGKEWTNKTGFGIWHVAYSPDGKKVAATVWNRDLAPDYAIVWDVSGDQEKELFRFSVPDMHLTSIAFSPDGREIAGGVKGDGTVRFWNAYTGALLSKVLRGHSGRLLRVIYSRDGKRIVTVSGDRTVRFWDATSGEEVLALHGHTNAVVDVSISANGQRLATASWDHTVRVWDAPRK